MPYSISACLYTPLVAHYGITWTPGSCYCQSALAATPPGGLFELVSCPHYLAEVVIYLGLVIASQGRLLPLLMLTWVVSAAAGCWGTGDGP